MNETHAVTQSRVKSKMMLEYYHDLFIKHDQYSQHFFEARNSGEYQNSNLEYLAEEA